MTMSIYPGGRYIIASRMQKPAPVEEQPKPTPVKAKRKKKQEE